MPRISAIDQLAQPALKFRYKIVWLHLPGTFVYAKAVTLPRFSMSDAVISRANYKIPVKSRITWEPVQITCYRFEAVTLIDLGQYFTSKIQKGSFADKRDFPALLEPHDQPAWKTKDLAIINMDTTGVAPLGMWKLESAFISAVDFGNLDWAANEVQEYTLTVNYSYATYVGL